MKTMIADDDEEGSLIAMKEFVSRDKMSRKNRRAMDRTKRTVWEMSPVTKIRESGKLYNRRKLKSMNTEY